MRFLVGVALLIGALLLPSTAKAQAPNCYCVWFVSQYTRTDTNFYRSHMAQRMKDLGLARKARDEVKDGLYDWNKEKKNTTSWCKRHVKACKAIAACVAGAAGSVAKDLADNASKDPGEKSKSARDVAIDATNICAALAFASLITP